MNYSNGGYRLVVRRGPQPNQVYELNQDMMTLGRDVNNEITVNDPEVSRHHCRLTRGPNGYTIEDLGSTNGTFVNGRRLTGAQPMNPGDLVGLGETVTLAYETGVGSASPAAPAGTQQRPPAGQGQLQQAQGGYGGGFQQPGGPAQPQQPGYGGFPPQQPQAQQPQYQQQAPYGGPPAVAPPPYYPDDGSTSRGNRGCGIFIGCGILIVLLLTGWIAAIIVLDTPLDDFRGINDAANTVPLPGSSVDNTEQYLDALQNECNVEEASNYVCSDEEDFHSNAANLQSICSTIQNSSSYSCSQDNNDVSCEFSTEGVDETSEIRFNITNGRVCGFVLSYEDLLGISPTIPDTSAPSDNSAGQ